MTGPRRESAAGLADVPPARLLDITRLISRAGRVPTGVDRVELAYLHHLPRHDAPFFAIARTTFGYVLLDQDGAGAIAARIRGAQPWGPPDTLSRFARSKPETVRRAESDLRRFALARCRPNRLVRMLPRHLPRGTAYLNVGHSNLTDRMLWTIRHGLGGRAAVLLHDCIPVDHPEFQRPGTPAAFLAMLKRVRAHASLIICNSQHSCDRVAAHMSGWGAVPERLVAHLGVETPAIGVLPAGSIPDRPYFMSLGTIEPRKGHDILLDVWDRLGAGADTPGLLICGNRGWNNEGVFDRLDRLDPLGPVRELNGLPDDQIGALLAGSAGLLFPSRAEGFGLPAAEAAALGVPVISADLPAVREILADRAEYVSDYTVESWKKAVELRLNGNAMTAGDQLGADFSPPSWQNHFNAVLRRT